MPFFCRLATRGRAVNLFLRFAPPGFRSAGALLLLALPLSVLTCGTGLIVIPTFNLFNLVVNYNPRQQHPALFVSVCIRHKNMVINARSEDQLHVTICRVDFFRVCRAKQFLLCDSQPINMLLCFDRVIRQFSRIQSPLNYV